MRITDLVKLQGQGDFLIIRTVKNPGCFKIKRLVMMPPVWIGWYKFDSLDSYRWQYAMLFNAAYSNKIIIDSSRKFTSKELDLIQDHGFRIIKLCDSPSFCIKERKRENGRWILLAAFQRKGKRNERISELLMDNRIISFE